MPTNRLTAPELRSAVDRIHAELAQSDARFVPAEVRLLVREVPHLIDDIIALRELHQRSLKNLCAEIERLRKGLEVYANRGDPTGAHAREVLKPHAVERIVPGWRD